MAVLLVLAGMVFVLPGLCSLFFIAMSGREALRPVGLLWLILVGIGVLGAMLIRFAIKNR